MSSSKLSSDYPRPIRALLSIRPEFVASILAGEKRYEFRRSIFARPVDVVVVYVTMPVHKVVAEFDVRSVITEPVQALWRETRQFAGIDEQRFFNYFDGKEYGHAIEIGEVRPYKKPFCPIEKLGIRPPQSFTYLGNIDVTQL